MKPAHRLTLQLIILFLSGCVGNQASKLDSLNTPLCKGPSVSNFPGSPAGAPNERWVQNGQSSEVCDEHPTTSIPVVITCSASPPVQLELPYWYCGSNEPCGGSTFRNPVTRPSMNPNKNLTCVPYTNNTGNPQRVSTTIQYVTP